MASVNLSQNSGGIFHCHWFGRKPEMCQLQTAPGIAQERLKSLIELVKKQDRYKIEISSNSGEICLSELNVKAKHSIISDHFVSWSLISNVTKFSHQRRRWHRNLVGPSNWYQRSRLYSRPRCVGKPIVSSQRALVLSRRVPSGPL